VNSTPTACTVIKEGVRRGERCSQSDARKRVNCSNFRVIIRLQPRRGWLRGFRRTERSLCCHEDEVWQSATNPKQRPAGARDAAQKPRHSAVTVRRVPVWLAPRLPRPVVHLGAFPCAFVSPPPATRSAHPDPENLSASAPSPRSVRQ
jgi:hypothetical protein